MSRAAVDIGGTFTDVVTVDESTGRLVQAKSLTTYPDPTPGFLNALAKATDRAALETVGYGTTLATNAVLTRSGARTALLTTEGFRDVLEIRRTTARHCSTSTRRSPSRSSPGPCGSRSPSGPAPTAARSPPSTSGRSGLRRRPSAGREWSRSRSATCSRS